MPDITLQPPAPRIGTFDGGKVSVDQSGDSATITLVIDPIDKATAPDITLTVYTLDSKGNRTGILTQGSVTPGPWTDKTGKLQTSGGDPQFSMNGCKGLDLAVEATVSKLVTCSVTANAIVKVQVRVLG